MCACSVVPQNNFHQNSKARTQYRKYSECTIQIWYNVVASHNIRISGPLPMSFHWHNNTWVRLTVFALLCLCCQPQTASITHNFRSVETWGQGSFSCVVRGLGGLCVLDRPAKFAKPPGETVSKTFKQTLFLLSSLLPPHFLKYQSPIPLFLQHTVYIFTNLNVFSFFHGSTHPVHIGPTQHTRTHFRLPGHPSRSNLIGQWSLCHGQAEETCARVPGCETTEDFTKGASYRSLSQLHII